MRGREGEEVGEGLSRGRGDGQVKGSIHIVVGMLVLESVCVYVDFLECLANIYIVKVGIYN